VTKKKLIHFKENLTFPHLFQPVFQEIQHGFRLRSKWNSDFFHNDHPLLVEMGCGKGEYTVGLAERNPAKNYIGIDIKGARLWRGSKTVQEKFLNNVAFIRSRVDFADKFFGENEVSEIWITFPDPQPGKERKRLTSPRFLKMYKEILKPEGLIHLKTDDAGFYEYTREIIRENKHSILLETDDLYHTGSPEEVTSIKTYYEMMWLQQEKKICYIQFRLH
jgi:tRNA (guanine-N7-)-methyltransferase